MPALKYHLLPELDALEQDILKTANELGIGPMGFGGKTTIYLEPVAMLLSRKAGRPVRIAMSRAEVFLASGPAPVVARVETSYVPAADGSHVAAAVAAGKLADVRNYCECDVLNTYLVYQRFRLSRGELSAGEYASEIALARERIGTANAPHWREFLAAWDAAI